MNIGIFNFNTGNLKSILHILKKIPININLHIIDNKFNKFKIIDKIIMPGQGSNPSIIENILNFKNEDIAYIFKNKQILGICIGKQIFFNLSEEFNCLGLNFFKGKIKKFFINKKFFKIPHIGWNKVFFLKNHPIIDNIKNSSFFYFSHSFYLVSELKKYIIGTTKYNFFFSSIFIKNNLFLFQFHPEKSSIQGFKIFYNFCKLK
ncbi:MAG: imidazole glycerol phosphate synthase subunit HisH [Candidatus Nasuia deltocephalinicola]